MNKEDIIQLIKEQYDGVSNITVEPEEIKVVIQIDMNFFKKNVKKDEKPRPTIDNNTPVEPTVPKTEEEINRERARRGAMATGGTMRSLQHIG